MTNDFNQIIVQGKIRSIYDPKTDFLLLNLSIGSAKDKVTGMMNYPTVVIPKELARDFKSKDFVKITGHIQSRMKRTKDNPKGYVTVQNIFGDKIEMAKPKLSSFFANEKGTIYDDLNEVVLAGEITDAQSVSDNVIRLIMRVNVNRQVNTIRLTYFCKNAKESLSKMVLHSHIKVVGNLQTHKKEKEGKTAYFENIVCTDFAIE